MGLFSKKKDDKVVEKSSKGKENVKSVAKKKKNDKKTVRKVEKKNNGVVPIENSEMAYKFVVRPWITEKTQELMSDNKYVFKLRLKTTKAQIKIAVEKLYNVKIAKINMINIPAKKRRFGRNIGKKSAVKKAIVTLQKGHKIEIFE